VVFFLIALREGKQKKEKKIENKQKISKRRFTDNPLT